MTFFITPDYVWGAAAPLFLVLGVCLRIGIGIGSRPWAERVSKATASLWLTATALLIVWRWPAYPEELFSRALAHDVGSQALALLLLTVSATALRATLSTDQPPLFLATAAALLLGQANDVFVAAFALEALLLAAAAPTRTRLVSVTTLLAAAAMLKLFAATELSVLAVAAKSAANVAALSAIPVAFAATLVVYLTKPTARYAFLVVFSVAFFVARYLAVVFAGASVTRLLRILN